jgi:hypothetical protein
VIVTEACVVWSGFAVGASMTDRADPGIAARRHSLDDSVTATVASRWCGRYYLAIASGAYSFTPGEKTLAAFPPLYPRAIELLGAITGANEANSALLVSNVCRMAGVVVFVMYIQAQTRVPSRTESCCAVAALCLFPPALFHHAGYSEPMFLVLVLGAFYGMNRGWPPVLIAWLAGHAIGTRLIGVAMVPAVALYFAERRGPAALFSLTGIAMLFVCCWGLALFMFELWQDVGDPFAFLPAQGAWSLRPRATMFNKLLGLVTLEPLWANYLNGSVCYWRRYSDGLPWYLCMQFFNPIVFLGAAGATAVGWRKKWLSPAEAAFSAGLLLFCYVTRGYDTCMTAQGRFMSVNFPVAIVVGHVLAMVSRPIRALCWITMGAYLGIFSALFAAGYLVL